MDPVGRAARYLATLSPAIAGQGGHNATMLAACRSVEFGLGEADAFALLCEWNQTHCQPPWTEAELRHKLADAFKRTGPKPSLTNAPGNGEPRRPLPEAGATRKRLILPPLRPGTAQDFAALASLRGLSVEGLRLASAHGLLRFAPYRGHCAWLVLDGSRRVAQARRLDGQPWADGVKAWTIAGSQGAWPVGIREAASCAAIAFCEGGPDLLAAHGFIVAEGREADCAAVALLGGCARVHPDALPLFAGKRVRLFPHLDETGQEAADRWAEQLADAGATVDAFSFTGLRRTDGAAVKDLCDLASIHADDFENNRCVWNLLPNGSEPTT